MKLSFGNIAIMLLAFFTLIGALTNPRLPEDQYNRSGVAGQPLSQSEQKENAELSSALLQDYKSKEAVTQAQDVPAAASPQVGLTVVHTAGKSFVPLRGYVEQHNGSLTYNVENATIDITIGKESFSLLLQEGIVMKNGYELNGHFFVQDGMTFISSETAETLSFPETLNQKNG